MLKIEQYLDISIIKDTNVELKNIMNIEVLQN